MEILNINKVIDQYKVDEAELAHIAFPGLRYPEPAFKRILSGSSSLSAEQISAIAGYLQIPVSDLFTVQNTDWHATSKNKQTTFYRGDYRVVISRDKFEIVLYKGQDEVDRAVGAFGIMTIQDFLAVVDEQIKKFENKVNNNI